MVANGWTGRPMPVKPAPVRKPTYGEALEDLALHYEHLATWWADESPERSDAYSRAAFLLWEVINA